MNSKSPNDFRWSIRLTGDERIYIGITSQEQSEDSFVCNYDKYAIIYSSYHGKIVKESNTIEIDANKAEPDGVIHFRFQPKLKKFSLSIVCTKVFSIYSTKIVCSKSFVN